MQTYEKGNNPYKEDVEYIEPDIREEKSLGIGHRNPLSMRMKISCSDVFLPHKLVKKEKKELLLVCY